MESKNWKITSSLSSDGGGGGGGGLVSKTCPTLVIPQAVVCQAPLSRGFPRQEYWSGLPFLSLGCLPDPGIEPGSPALQADSLPTELRGKPNIEEKSPMVRIRD